MTDFDQIDRAEVDATIHAVQAEIGTSFTWDYERSRPGLSRLYSKAKGSQWNATTDLDWSIDVDPERVSADLGGSSPVGRFGHLVDHPDSPVRSFGESEWTTVGVELQNSILSQFLHGEQGALLCTSRIVETVPWIDAKYYASTQVMDEARHVEVFARYLDTKLSGHYPVNAHLKMLLDDIITDSRWDMTYLGMQVMVEGLALAAFTFMREVTDEPLIKALTGLVIRDEARHVAFGVLALKDHYTEAHVVLCVCRMEDVRDCLHVCADEQTEKNSNMRSQQFDAPALSLTLLPFSRQCSSIRSQTCAGVNPPYEMGKIFKDNAAEVRRAIMVCVGVCRCV